MGLQRSSARAVRSADVCCVACCPSPTRVCYDCPSSRVCLSSLCCAVLLRYSTASVAACAGCRRSAATTPPAAASASTSALVAASSSAAVAASVSGVPRATPCGRKSISAEQRYVYFKAFLVWLLFSLGGWSSIPPEYLPIFSHSVGFAFFLVLTTKKTRWLGAIFCGALLFSFLVYQTLPRRWIQIVVNASGLTAFLITAVLVTACTVVRQGIHRTSVSGAAGLMPRRSKHGSSSFASLRNEILGGGSCADSSIAKFCSGRYLEEHLESQGYVTLNETTNRVSELHLLGSTALHVDAAVDQASQIMAPVFRRAGDWMDEVGQILARVANEAEFIKFIKLTETSPEGQGADADAAPGETAADETDGPARSIHMLSSPEGEEDDDLHSTPTGEWSMVASDREEGQPLDAASVPILPSRPPNSPPSPARMSSDNSAALIVAATSSSDDLGSAAFLSNASRPHLYAVIRHLNSQLLHVEAGLRAASESQRRSEMERSTFSKTISNLKQNLDRESTQKSIVIAQLNQMVQRQKEDEIREKRAAAVRDGTASAADLDPATESETTLKHHLKVLKSKAKSLQNDLWNSNYVLGLSRTRIKVLEDALASAGKTEAALRDSSEKQTREHALIIQRTKEDHARATAKLQRECDAKLRALEAEVNKQTAIAEKALAAAAAASSTQSASSSSSSSGSSGADSSSDESAAAPRANPHALITRLQAQIAELTAQSAQAASESKRTQQRQTHQLDAASATIATLRSQISSLEGQIASLQAALQDAASKLTVEQTIVTSLSNPLSSQLHEADELAAIFQRGHRRDRTGAYDSADLTPSTTASSSSSHLSGLDAGHAHASAAPDFGFGHDELDFLDEDESEHSTPGQHDHDQDPIDARVVAELDQQLLQHHNEEHAQINRDSTIAPMRRTAADSSSILSSAPWSLYSSSLAAAPASSLSMRLHGGHSSWSSSAMWSSSAPLSGAEEHSQLARQLDALEARVRELKQQQHGAAAASPAVIAPPTSVSQSWPSRS